MFTYVRSLPRTLFAINIRHYVKRKPRADRKRPEVQNFGPNPGMDRIANLLKTEGVIDSVDDFDPEWIEESESDFTKAGRAYKKHQKEMSAKREIVKQNIVKRKYFHENFPNLLTWSEKEQIRYLHSENPNDWTAERISESFPVTAESARNIIKAAWKPANQDRIDRHDASALRNWKQLKEGTLEGVSPETRESLLKFSERVIPPRRREDIAETQNLNRFSGEFTGLLRGYREEAERSLKVIEDGKTEDPPVTGNNIDIDVKKTKSQHALHSTITLEQLRKGISEKMERNREVPESDKLIINSREDGSEAIATNTSLTMDLNSNRTTNVDIPDKFKEKAETVFDYTKRIRIPKKAYKKGATYKINDCYYDDDGTFLYRVPGMTDTIYMKSDNDK